MKNVIFRNLTLRDTFFGLDMTDLVVMACVVNIVFRFHRATHWSGKILNVVIVLGSYLSLILIKRQFPKGYLNNMVRFLFKRRRFVPDRDVLKSAQEVLCEKERD